MTTFSPDVVTAILRHMNDDHRDDSLVIVRANGSSDALEATMTGFDGDGGDWLVREPAGERALRVPWSEAITERAQVRREIVRMYEDALLTP